MIDWLLVSEFIYNELIWRLGKWSKKNSILIQRKIGEVINEFYRVDMYIILIYNLFSHINYLTLTQALNHQ